MEDLLPLVLVLLLLFLAVSLIVVAVQARKYASLKGQIPSIRRDASQRSRAVTRGQVAEQLFPYLPEFSYDPRDARFLGSPIDFVVFDGLEAGEVKSVIFVEVKTGASTLTTRERRVRDAVKAGNVRWEELRHGG